MFALKSLKQPFSPNTERLQIIENFKEFPSGLIDPRRTEGTVDFNKKLSILRIESKLVEVAS
jgi:hypothetical protein